MNTSNSDRISLSDIVIVSAGNKISVLDKLQTEKYTMLKYFPGGLEFFPE